MKDTTDFISKRWTRFNHRSLIKSDKVTLLKVDALHDFRWTRFNHRSLIKSDKVTLLKVDALHDFMTFTTNYAFQGEAVQLVADGEAPKLKQTEEGATYEPIAKKDLAKVRC